MTPFLSYHYAPLLCGTCCTHVDYTEPSVDPATRRATSYTLGCGRACVRDLCNDTMKRNMNHAVYIRCGAYYVRARTHASFSPFIRQDAQYAYGRVYVCTGALRLWRDSLS